MKKQEQKNTWNGTRILRLTWNIVSTGLSIFIFLFFLFILVSIGSAFASSEFENGNVAVIAIKGIITTDSDIEFEQTTKSDDVVDLIKKAEKNNEIKAILLDIDSPGGTPVASDEISRTVKESNKTIVAVIRETGASGAYWIASAADKIYANRMSITGSIGVTASSFDLSNLITQWNISYRRMVSGDLKDAGTPFRPLTDKEKQLFQKILDDLREQFIDVVATNRNLSREKVIELATGFIYLGNDAVKLGLVDELGSKQDALEYIEKTLNITAEPVEYKIKKSFADILAEVSAQPFYAVGAGMTQGLVKGQRVSLTY